MQHISSHPRFGIYGDGQLARLLAIEIINRGFTPLLFTLKKNHSPCLDLSVEWIEGSSFTDEKNFQKFSSQIDVLFLENEFIPFSFLTSAEELGVRCFPDAQSYKALSDKLKQVRLAEKNLVQIPKTTVISNDQDLKNLKHPVILKSIRGGYDGYGNFLFQNENLFSLASAFIQKNGTTLAQEIIDFDCEVAVMVLSTPEKVSVFPIAETIQENHICHMVISPPRLSDDQQNKILKEATKIISSLKGYGLFGVEFFIRGSDVIFNEIAPRPHNSAHFSIEGCSYSQFSGLVELALGHTPPENKLRFDAVGMLNLLGTKKGNGTFVGDERFFKKDGSLHLYQKKVSKLGRKMGHFTLSGVRDEILKELTELKGRYEL
jgi:5-(carboxyamino)imidazole ribonucleotide synthase